MDNGPIFESSQRYQFCRWKAIRNMYALAAVARPLYARQSPTFICLLRVFGAARATRSRAAVAAATAASAGTNVLFIL